MRARALFRTRRSLTAAAATTLLAASALALPPSPAVGSGLIAAYDHYVTGQGFELGIVDAASGRQIPLPAGVNTAADELHPALSPDGRFLWFTRTTLLPQLNGDIVAPATTQMLVLDRQQPISITAMRAGAGAVMSVNGNRKWLAWGLPPSDVVGARAPTTRFGQLADFTGSTLGSPSDLTSPAFPPSTGTRNTPHAAAVGEVDPNPSTGARGVRRYTSQLTTDPATGALVSSLARLTFLRDEGNGTFAFSDRSFGAPGTPAGHPVPRTTDGLVAFDLSDGLDVDIQTVAFPGSAAPVPAPVPSVTTDEPERMPAWSADGVRLGFVRTTGGHRKLGVFDATPGIQTVVNPLVDLGADAPTPQTRGIGSHWGGISLADSSALDAPVVTCDQTCLATVLHSAGIIRLKPTVSATVKGQAIGIFVVRVTGTQKLLGRRVARITPIGRVPLGATKKGRNSFGWDGRVAGKRLAAGTYLLTYRVLRSDRIVSLSSSIRVRIGAHGKVLSVRREK